MGGEQERVQALYFTVGKIYTVLYRDKRFVKMEDDNGEQCWFDGADYSTSSSDSITSWFTFDKSWEDYEYRKSHEKFGI